MALILLACEAHAMGSKLTEARRDGSPAHRCGMDPPDGVDSQHRRRPVGLVGNLLHPATPPATPKASPAPSPTATVGPRSPRHRPRPDPRARRLVPIARSIHGGLPGALARLGSVAAVAGVTVGLILVTLDGLAAKQLAEAWATAPPQDQAARAAAASGRGDHQLRPGALFSILFAGVTFILYGLAVAWSQLYPRWLGWVVVRAGLGLVAAGLIQASAGEATTVTRTLTIIFPTVITPMVDPDRHTGVPRAPATEGAIAGEL
jgi:Domain of unknown function (DUF4386)